MEEQIVLTSICKHEPKTEFLLLFSRVVARIVVQLGCKAPDEQGTLIIAENALKYFPEISTEEIKVAFDMYASGLLTYEDGKKPEHFQQFSYSFFVEVINLYKVKRNKVVYKVKQIVMGVNTEDPAQIEAREKEARKKILEKIRADFETDDPEIYAIKYEVLEEIGAIKLTNEEKKAYMVQAAERMRTDAVASGEFKAIKQLTAGMLQSEQKSVAKRLAYADFLKDKRNINKINLHG